jgi:hemolysin-activating ACP:hemolysin acyltransferase
VWKRSTVEDWLKLHKLDVAIVEDVTAGLRNGALATEPAFPISSQSERAVLPACGECLDRIVQPAVAGLIGVDKSTVLAELRLVEDASETSFLPCTLDRGQAEIPVILMRWSGTSADLLCLAHEYGHAVQLVLSAGSPMPPVAREVCAFLGELALIRWSREHAPDLYGPLIEVWRAENARYFDEDLDDLRADLRAPDKGYQYRLNYPLARAMAVQIETLWGRDEITGLFACGDRAMEILPYSRLADEAAALPNYLPPFSSAGPPEGPLSAYRSLGAITLLDVDGRSGRGDALIAHYYDETVHHLKTSTVFIALRPDGRPIGYATWQVEPQTDAFILTHQVAPFGDYRVLQDTLREHMSHEGLALAVHQDSARREQRAW